MTVIFFFCVIFLCGFFFFFFFFWCGLLVNQSCTPLSLSLSLWYIRVLSESWGFLRAIPKVLRFLSLTVPQSPLLLFRQTASRACDPERVSDEARSRDSVTLTKGTLLAQIHHEIHCRLESSARRFNRTLSCSQLKTSACPPPPPPPACLGPPHPLLSTVHLSL